ncbi:hypothetical protein PV343_02940 [Streptomyces sp. WI03-4A]|uniref:hypothetical protein n=1 Tax=Streptomyces sp. WI03-4A TaxID=3028706 RepID=UPI0029BE4397|nr:hypothetical protein [Streptomyces sp. WI03-4A]MDX2591279.1 hypothetical protein [Streptomyces sp. WI03-4A]
MGLLLELQKRIPSGWLLRRLLPAVLFVVVAVVGGGQLGWAHWSDLGLARRRIADALRLGEGFTSSGVAMLVLLAVAAAGAALAVPFAASAVSALACGAWPWWLSALARRLTALRLGRWSPPDEIAREAVRARAAGRETLAARLDARRARTSSFEPAGPTWSGDRLRTTERRIRETSDMDIAEAWTRLVLTAPDSFRDALTAARDAYDGACEAVVWSIAFTVVGAWWWPSAFVGVLLGLAFWRSLRQAVEALCHTTEAVVDLLSAPPVTSPAPSP